MARKEEKLRLPCDVCFGRGLLWLGGKDYVECPQCEGRKQVEMVEARITPPLIFAVTRR